MSFWETCKLDEKYQKVFVGVFIFSIIYVSSILLADVQYWDDVERSLGGGAWNHNARPLMSWLTYILHGHRELMDIAPWSQILGIAILDYSAVLWVKKNMADASWSKSVIAASFVYVNLFLLGNLAFGYDSMAMMFGLGMAFMLYSLSDDLSAKLKIVLSTLVVVILLCIYQPLAGAYIALAIVDVYNWVIDNKTIKMIAYRLIPRVVGMAVGGIIYKLILILAFSDLAGYTAAHAGLVNPFSLAGLENIYANIIAYEQLFTDYFKTIRWIGLLLIITMYVALAYSSYRVWHSPKNIYGKIAAVAFILLLPMVLLFASIMPLVFLKSPIFAHRLLISFSVFTLFEGYIIYQLSKKYKKIMLVGILSLMIILSHATYFGNLVRSQEKLDFMVATFIVEDINDIEREQGKIYDKVAVLGRSIKCRELLLADKGKPLYSGMVVSNLTGSWLSSLYLTHFRVHALKFETDANIGEKIKGLNPSKVNEYCKIYALDDKIVIAFEPR